MQKKTLVIVNKLGLHARAAAQFVKLASQFDCEIMVTRGQREVNGKSIMGLLMLAAAKGCEINVSASGSDEDEAIHEIEMLVNKGFYEEIGD